MAVMFVRMPSKTSPHPKLFHPQHFTVLVPCISLVILGLLCSQPAHCSHPHCHLQSLLHHNSPLSNLAACCIPILLQLIPLLPSQHSLLMLPLPTSGSHHRQVSRYSSNSITYLIQSCPLQTSQPHLYFSVTTCIALQLWPGTHRAEDSLWASQVYLLIDFPTLKEILCSCDVGLQFP